jgi:hypothetical protein
MSVFFNLLLKYILVYNRYEEEWACLDKLLAEGDKKVSHVSDRALSK